MGWIARIRKLLGAFWTRLFGAYDFILWVENLLGMLALRQQAKQDKWLAGKALSLSGRYQDRLPYVMLLRKSSIVDGEPRSAVGHPACSVLSVLTGEAGPAELDSSLGWALTLQHTVPSPELITGHVIGSCYTLFGGIDYDFIGKDRIVLHVDPEVLDWPVVRMDDADGNLVEYYRVFGWMSASAALEDSVAAFESPELADIPEAAWRVHQDGATNIAAKRLIAEACGSVVCLEDGMVLDMWTEGKLHCAIVGDRLYSSFSPAADGVSVGAWLKTGDTLFGTLRCYPELTYDAEAGRATRVFPSADEVPGIHVMTDAGELFAANADDVSSIQSSGVLVLPLTAPGRPGAVAKYVDKCVELSGMLVPALQVPTVVNPCRFILETLRAGCYMLITLSAEATGKLAAALACVRRSAVASGMMHVYIRAVGEQISVHAGAVSGSSTAFRAAVAVTCTAAVDNMSASVNVLI